jgi:hypothetical protein
MHQQIIAVQNESHNLMFKKSDNPGDKTPKKETKDHGSKAEPAASQSAPAAEKKAEAANDAKKS